MDRPGQENASAAAILMSAIFLGIVVLFAAWGSSRAVEYLSPEGTPEWVSVFVNYSVMLAVSMILILASSMGNPSRFGFRRAVRFMYGAGVLWGILLGALGTVTILLARRGGLTVLGGLEFWHMVLLIWIMASVAEEILVRGYIQGYLEPLVDRSFTIFGLRMSLPVVLCALFFSAMHLILLTTGTPPLTVYIVMVFTFALGLLAGYQREQTKSVIPAITAHIFFNVGGVIGGILFVLSQIIFFGKTAAEVARMIAG